MQITKIRNLLTPKLFKALSDPKRLSLLVRLAEERGPCTVSDVARGSGVDLSVVSRHLAILRDAGILRCDRQGREVRCAVRTDAVAKLLRDLADALEACCPEPSPSPRAAGERASSARRGERGGRALRHGGRS